MENNKNYAKIMAKELDLIEKSGKKLFIVQNTTQTRCYHRTIRESYGKELIEVSRKILDFIAALCFCFDVDWDEDFPDDEFCLERKSTARRTKIVEVPSGAEVPIAS